MKKCKEQWKTIPFTSEHLWNAEIHGIPYGPCVKCGYPTEKWNAKMERLAKILMEKDPSVFIKQ